MALHYPLHLDFDEERVAQILTRDAWSYFSSPTELPDRHPVREVPKMPANGVFRLSDDPTIISYYLNFAPTYYDELKELGWPPRMYMDACERLISKIERATGAKRRAPIPTLDRDLTQGP
jgi:hypothetical protein